MEQNNNSSPEAILASAKETSSGTNTPRSQGRNYRKPGDGSRRQERDAKRRWMKPTVRRVKVLGRGPVGGGSAYGGQEAEKERIGGLKIVHFGGLGEVGRNMSAIQYDDEIILIDAGVRFGDEKMPGIDFIIPNPSYLDDKQHMVKAMFFTHGHMDHIGALPFLLNRRSEEHTSE